jgi:hypothetical protein
MSVSNDTLQANLEASANALLQANGVKRYRMGDVEAERESPVQMVKALMMLRGLTSSKRGISVARIENAG